MPTIRYTNEFHIVWVNLYNTLTFLIHMQYMFFNALTIFYIHATIAIFSAVLVISVRNPIHSVLFLILVFFNTSALLILLEAEFLAMLLIVVYVGAIAVLFLFVVMMLNIKVAVSSFNFFRYLPVGGLLIVLFAFMVYGILSRSALVPEAIHIQTNIHNLDGLSPMSSITWVEELYRHTNIEAIGITLYTKYADVFIISGIILLLAMISAINLTFSHNSSVKRQDIFQQVSRTNNISLFK